MSELRGPVRHGNRARRPVRPPSSTVTGSGDGVTAAEDLQAVFTALARRAKLPTGPDARPTEVLRTAGIPLLMAAIVAGSHPLPGTPDLGEGPTGPGATQSGSAPWTVTTLGQPTRPAPAPGPSVTRKPATNAGPPVGRAAAAPRVRHTTAPGPTHDTHPAPPTHAPVVKAPAAEEAQADARVPAGPRITYTVRPGDTLHDIAMRSGRNLAAIVGINHLTPGHEVVPGQVLVLPDTTIGPRPTKAKTAAAPETTAHPAKPATTIAPRTVPLRKGAASETLPTKTAPAKTAPATTRTAHAKATPVKTAAPAKTAPAKAAHGKAAHGKVAAKAESPASPTTRPYVVKPGDSLIGISQSQHVKLHDVLELNDLHLQSVIHPDQVLKLPAPPKPEKDSLNTFAGRTYPPAVVAAANANRAKLANAKVPSKDQVKAMVVSTARAMGVDPALALGIAYLESGFQQRVVSPANAVGSMQVTPSAGKWASQMVGRPLDLLNAKDNITAGVALLHALTAAAANEPQAIAGYYQGLSSVQRNGMYDDTRRYVANVQTLKTRFTTGS